MTSHSKQVSDRLKTLLDEYNNYLGRIYNILSKLELEAIPYIKKNNLDSEELIQKHLLAFLECKQNLDELLKEFKANPMISKLLMEFGGKVVKVAADVNVKPEDKTETVCE